MAYYYHHFFSFCNIDYSPKFSSIHTTFHTADLRALAGVPAPSWGLQPRTGMYANIDSTPHVHDEGKATLLQPWALKPPITTRHGARRAKSRRAMHLSQKQQGPPHDEISTMYVPT